MVGFLLTGKAAIMSLAFLVYHSRNSSKVAAATALEFSGSVFPFSIVLVNV